MKAGDYRKMTEAELEKELDGLRKSLFQIRTKKVTDVVENSAMIRGLRRDIARLQTVVTERRRSKPKTAAPTKA